MAEASLAGIDFARYQRWLARMAGGDCAIKVFDAMGQTLWGGGADDGELGRRLLDAPQEQGAGVRSLELDTGQILLYRPLHVAAALAGWVALVADGRAADAAPLELERMAEALDDVAAGVALEAASNCDLEQMAEELGECYEDLHMVFAVDAHMKGHAWGDQDVLRALLRTTAEHMRADVAVFVRPSDELCVYATFLSKEIHNLDLVLVEMRGDLFRFVQVSRESVVLNAPDDPRRSYIFTDMPYRILACPVQIERGVDGMVVLLNHVDKPPFSNSDRRLLEILANQLSSLGKGFLLLRNLGTFTKQIADAMIEAVEAKDPYTRGHSERVNQLSMEIGRAIGLSAEELEDLHWGSLLHDVGKIGIPDAVLCKPARLTKDEYAFIMLHPERTYEILRGVEQLKNALPGARHHQEMFDGKGYPHGLKGERIPLHARIMAVADTYDSITSSRAYRAGRSHEVALREIERVSGTQLDPAIVEVFKKVCASEPEWIRRFNIRRDKAA